MKSNEFTDSKGVYKDVEFLNYAHTMISGSYEKLAGLLKDTYFVVTAVDGCIDRNLKNALVKRQIGFTMYENICLIHADSSLKFLEYIHNIPDTAFYCANQAPSEENMRKISSGYAEEFGPIDKNMDLMKHIYTDLKLLNSFLYVSQGSANLLLAVKK